MPELSLQEMVFVLGVVALTITATITDLWMWKIPNWLTLPAFAAGWIYQGSMRGWEGLGDGGLGFLVGFGTFFVLFAIGSGGGGDTKLMGALSVWLGFTLTLYVMVITIALVIVGSFVVFFYSLATRGMKKTMADAKSGRSSAKTSGQVAGAKLSRIGGLMAYAAPMAIATWLVLVLDAYGIRSGQLRSKAFASEMPTPQVSQHASP
jgi:prepilin peptidase CpaA